MGSKKFRNEEKNVNIFKAPENAPNITRNRNTYFLIPLATLFKISCRESMALESSAKETMSTIFV